MTDRYSETAILVGEKHVTNIFIMDKTSKIKLKIGIPEDYIMPKIEEQRLYNIICEATIHQEDRLFRLLDFSALCAEQYC